jgi:hypothetical protein
VVKLVVAAEVVVGGGRNPRFTCISNRQREEKEEKNAT